LHAATVDPPAQRCANGVARARRERRVQERHVACVCRNLGAEEQGCVETPEREVMFMIA
jgi:hypothetical protein